MWLRRDETGERQPGYRRNLCLRPGAIVQAQLSEFVLRMLQQLAKSGGGGRGGERGRGGGGAQGSTPDRRRDDTLR